MAANPQTKKAHADLAAALVLSTVGAEWIGLQLLAKTHVAASVSEGMRERNESASATVALRSRFDGLLSLKWSTSVS